MISYPFDSEITGYEADGSPIYDRAADSSVLRRWMMHYFTDGVFAEGNSLGFNVLQGDGLTVTVSAGSATIQGAIGIEDSIRTLETKAANATYDRIDTVVARLNLETDVRNIDLYIIQGEPASSPVRPTLTRNLSIWELGVADIRIPKNSTQITQANINDTRLDTTRCGVVASPFVTLDTEQIYLQIMSDITERQKEAAALYGVYQGDINTHEANATTAYNNYVASMQSYQTAAKNDFDVWFQTIKGILDEETAGNLQNQIDELKKKNPTALLATVDATGMYESPFPVCLLLISEYCYGMGGYGEGPYGGAAASTVDADYTFDDHSISVTAPSQYAAYTNADKASSSLFALFDPTGTDVVKNMVLQIK